MRVRERGGRQSGAQINAWAAAARARCEQVTRRIPEALDNQTTAQFAERERVGPVHVNLAKLLLENIERIVQLHTRAPRVVSECERGGKARKKDPTPA